MKIELAHDILAKRIYDRSSAEDKVRVKIHQLLTEHLTLYKENGVLLNKDDLAYIQPFLDTIELLPEEFNLVKKSTQFLKQRRRKLILGIAIVVVLLVAFNLITWSSNQKNAALLEEELKQVALLQREDSLKVLAELRADTLYQQLMASNPEFAQQLIASFDTLKISKQKAENQRNIAQSATLSNLAETALEQQDKNYAFRLAAKAWDLNHDNQLACKILYIVNDDPSYDRNNDENRTIDSKTKEEHDRYILQLIAQERSEKGRGELDEETLKLIFNKENTVITEKEKGVRNKLEEYMNKVQSKAGELYKDAGNALKGN